MEMIAVKDQEDKYLNVVINVTGSTALWIHSYLRCVFKVPG